MSQDRRIARGVISSALMVTRGDGKQRKRARERGALTGNGVTTRHPVTRFFGRPVPFRFSRITGPSGPALASFGPKRTSIGSLVRQTRRGDGRVPGNVALNGLIFPSWGLALVISGLGNLVAAN